MYEVFVKKAPACTVLALAETMLRKYGDGDLNKIEVVGIRPGEKIDEVLVNEYEIQRASESDSFFTIPGEYRGVRSNNKFPHGYEYTSSNTKRLDGYEEISSMLDMMGTTDFYT